MNDETKEPKEIPLVHVWRLEKHYRKQVIIGSICGYLLGLALPVSLVASATVATQYVDKVNYTLPYKSPEFLTLAPLAIFYILVAYEDSLKLNRGYQWVRSSCSLALLKVFGFSLLFCFLTGRFIFAVILLGPTYFYLQSFKMWLPKKLNWSKLKINDPSQWESIEEMGGTFWPAYYAPAVATQTTTFLIIGSVVTAVFFFIGLVKEEDILAVIGVGLSWFIACRCLDLKEQEYERRQLYEEAKAAPFLYRDYE